MLLMKCYAALPRFDYDDAAADFLSTLSMRHIRAGRFCASDGALSSMSSMPR